MTMETSEKHSGYFLSIKVLLLLVALFVTLKALDAFVAFMNREYAKIIWSPINTQGYRSDFDYTPREVGDKKTRIAVIGDSFSYGRGVKLEDSFPVQLSEFLNKNSENKYEVFNFGKSSMDAFGEINILKEILPAYKPDIIIWQFVVNDIGGAIDNPNHAREQLARKQTPTAAYFLKNVSYSILPNLYDFFGTSIRRIYSGLFKYRRTVFNDPSYVFREWGGLYPSDILPQIKSRWQEFEVIIEKAVNLTQKNNSRFVFLIIPSEVEIGERYIKELEKNYLVFVDPSIAKSGYMHKRLADLCAARTMTCIDLLDDFLVLEKEKPIYLSKDYHLNPFGNSIVAQQLAHIILSQK